MDNDELKRLLSACTKELSDKIRKEVPQRDVPYEERNITKFAFRPYITDFCYVVERSSPINKIVKEYTDVDIFNYISTKVDEFDSYKNLVGCDGLAEHIAKINGTDIAQTKGVLTNFLVTVIKKYLNRGDETTINRQIDEFLNYLNQLPVKYSIKMFVYGAQLVEEVPKIEANSNGLGNILLRNIEPSDLSFSIPKYLSESRALGHFETALIKNQLVPPLIIEADYSVNDRSNLGNYQALKVADSVINILRLLRPVRFVAGKIDVDRNSFGLFTFGIEHTDYLYRKSYTNALVGQINKLDKEQIDKAKEMIDRYWNIIFKVSNEYTDYMRGDTASEVETAIAIALEHYKDSLFENKYIERQIASSVMCLEAIWFMNNKGDYSKKTKKLINRIGRIDTDKLTYISQTDLRGSLSEAYEIRSSFLHGFRSNKSYEELLKIANITVELARVSLLLLLETNRAGNTKEDLVNFADGSNPKLQDTVNNTLNCFCPVYVGKVDHYYDRIKVGVLKTITSLKKNACIRVCHDDKFSNHSVYSIQIDKKEVSPVPPGSEIGLKIDGDISKMDRIYLY